MEILRAFAMPHRNTFSIPPIRDFVLSYLRPNSVDPFARDCKLARYTNDLNPKTTAEFHLDAEIFLLQLAEQGRKFDCALFDPPYSPRQISECYNSIGLVVSTEETQNGRLYKRVRDVLNAVMVPGGFVLSFGWNSNGMGKGRGYEIRKILLAAHGGAHNDTICMAEQKL